MRAGTPDGLSRRTFRSPAETPVSGGGGTPPPLRRPAWLPADGGLETLPVPFFLALCLALRALDCRTAYEVPWLLTGLNFVFLSGSSLLVAVLVVHRFLGRGAAHLLWLGCGAVVLGGVATVGSIVGQLNGAASGFDVNALVTIHNTGAWLAALLHLAAAVLPGREPVPASRRLPWLAAGGLASAAVIGGLVLVTLQGWLPVFFVQGEGGTLPRQVVLGAAIVTFGFAAMLIERAPDSSRSPFPHWYGLALWLTAIGLLGALMQPSVGSPLGWVARSAQYLAGAYMAYAVFRCAQFGAAQPLPVRDFRHRGLASSFALALLLVANAAVVPLALTPEPDLVGEIVAFYPAVVLAALLGGWRAGALAALTAFAFLVYFILEPAGSFAIDEPRDRAAALLFALGSAIVVAWVRQFDRAWLRMVDLEAQLRFARTAAERLGALADRGIAGVCETDAAGRIRYVNDRFCEILGRDRRTLLGLAIPEIVHPDDREASRSAFSSATRERRDFGTERRYLRPDGSVVWAFLSVTFDAGSPGKEPGCLALLIDITERKEAEFARRALADQWRTALDSLSDAVFIADARGRFVDFNPGFVRFHRFADRDTCRLSLDECKPVFEGIRADGTRLPVDEWPLVRALRGEQAANFEIILRRKDTGEQWDANYSFAPLRDAEGRVTGAVIVARDISGRKARERALALAEERLRLATEGAQAGTWYWDFASGTHDWSDLCRHLVALPPDGKPGLEHIRAVLHPEDRERVDRLVKAAVEQVASYKAEYRVVLPDGATRWLGAFGKAYANPDGSPQGMGGVLLDITARKEAESRLAERAREVELLNRDLDRRALDAETASRAKEALLRNVSHELRTPLNQIVGGAELLLRDARDGNQERWALLVKNASLDLMTRISDLLDAARAAAGELSLESVDFSIERIFDELRLMMATRASAKGLALDTTIEPGLPDRVRGDPTRLAQALLNYLDNAVKFTERGRVTISARVESHDAQGLRVRFSVSDTGIGIAPDVLASLFTPFTQGDASTTRRHGGMGIGLAISRELAILMGGYAGAESQPGVGSTFWLTVRFPPSGA